MMCSANAFAQRGGREGVARIHAAKMAFLSDKLHLTPAQYSNFAPVYNEYEQEIKATRQLYLGKYKNNRNNDPDNAASLKYIDDNLDYQQAVIDLKRKYNDHFLRTISPQQLAALYKAEREFRQLLEKKLNGQPRTGGRFR